MGNEHPQAASTQMKSPSRKELLNKSCTFTLWTIMHQSQRVTSLYLPDTDKERLSRQANYGEFPGGAVVRTQAL